MAGTLYQPTELRSEITEGELRWRVGRAVSWWSVVASTRVGAICHLTDHCYEPGGVTVLSLSQSLCHLLRVTVTAVSGVSCAVAPISSRARVKGVRVPEGLWSGVDTARIAPTDRGGGWWRGVKGVDGVSVVQVLTPMWRQILPLVSVQ